MDSVAKIAIKSSPWLIYVLLIVAAVIFTDIFQCQARRLPIKFLAEDKFNLSRVDGLDQNKCGRISTVPYQWMLTDQSFTCLDGTRGDYDDHDWKNNYDEDQDDVYDMYYRRRGGRHRRRAAPRRGLPSRPSKRVAGGFSPQYGQFPSHVQVILANNREEWSCGGVLIHHDLALTAAHCVERQARYQITVVGGTILKASSNNARSGQLSSVSKICVPTEFDELTFEGDWALVRLDQPFKYSDRIQPACLELNAPPLDKAICVGVGMGASERPTNQLKALLMEKCQSDMKTSSCYKGVNESGQLCGGDDGGALYCYDNCDRKAGTKMFAVGISSAASKPTDCSAEANTDIYFADMYENRDSIVSLLISCLNKTVDSYERRHRWKDVW